MSEIFSRLPVVSAAEMRDFERRSFGAGVVSERVVMESAGRAVAQWVAGRYPTGRVVAVVGKGNNGRDALVAVRSLSGWGREVACLLLPGVEVEPGISHLWDIPRVTTEDLRASDILLDGLLGTGAHGAPRDDAAALIPILNRVGATVVAVDLPSGVDPTTGAIPGPAVLADVTITFGAIKSGLLLHPGRAAAGELVLAECGFPPSIMDVATGVALNDAWATANLPDTRPDAHKGQLGTVTIIAGRSGLAGAAVMACMGALRAGAGGVRVVSVDANRWILQSAVPEAIFVRREQADEAIRAADAVLVGPGMGLDSAGEKLLDEVLDAEVAAVVDADALTLLAHRGGVRPGRRRLLLTPHPGELGRLTGETTDSVVADRLSAATRAAGQYEATLLAKGAPSLVVSPGDPVLYGTSGHSGVATGGMGDTLGGVAAAFLGRGISTRHAAGLALHLCGRAAEIAGRGQGLMPRDIADSLPEAIAHLQSRSADPPFLWQFPDPC